MTTVAPMSSVWTAWSLMLRTGRRHLVVAVGDVCYGVINDRTLFAQWFEGPLGMRRRKVSDLPASGVTVMPGTDLRMVACAMVSADTDTDAVPVLDAQDRLVGIVTTVDIVRAVAASGVWMEEAS